jgi:hypothetical protein
MSLPSPSEEAFLEIYQVAQRCVARPGEKVIGLALFVLTDGPEGDGLRSVISPAEAHKAVLRIIRPRIDGVLEEEEEDP